MKLLLKTLLIFSLLLTSACTISSNNPISASVYHYSDNTRHSWINKEDYRPLNTTIWYPAPLGTVEKRHRVAIFNTGIYASNSEIRKSENAYPLVILSHGTGGSTASIAWFAEVLAQNGLIVASINHHGNTGAEPSYLLNGFILWWERPQDITKVIDYILKDTKLNKIVDPNRIAVAGFSLGGYTALATVGATLEINKWIELKKNDPNDPNTILPPEAKFTMDEVEKFINTDPDAIESIKHANDSYLDSRIKAAFVMAPVLVPLMNAESLNNINVPVRIITGDKDDQSILEKNGIPLSQSIPNVSITVLKNVSHYTFLSEGSFVGKLFARKYTTDTLGINRGKVHAEVGELAVAFFNNNL